MRLCFPLDVSKYCLKGYIILRSLRQEFTPDAFIICPLISNVHRLPLVLKGALGKQLRRNFTVSKMNPSKNASDDLMLHH